ncbi:MAG: hypothetical protein ABII74_01635 [Elusimicrobiota bacterium]
MILELGYGFLRNSPRAFLISRDCSATISLAIFHLTAGFSVFQDLSDFGFIIGNNGGYMYRIEGVTKWSFDIISFFNGGKR